MNCNESKIIFKMKLKESINEFKVKKKAPEVARLLIVILGALLIGKINPFIQDQSFLLELIIISISAIMLSWALVFFSISSKLYFLNKDSLLLLTGVNINSVFVADSVTYTLKKNLETGLLIAIIFATDNLFVAPIYLITFLLISAISFLIAQICLVLFQKTFKCKSVNQLNFLTLFILLIIALLIGFYFYLTDTTITSSLFESYGVFFLSLYICFALALVFFSLLKSKKVKEFYLYGVDYLNNKRGKGRKDARYKAFSSIKNPLMYKDILLLLSNPITKFRFYVWILCMIFFVYFLEAKGLSFYLNLLPFSTEDPEWFVYQISIAVPYLIFGEMILSLFQLEKGIIQWYSLTGFNSRKILYSKMLLGVNILFIPSILTTTICLFFVEISFLQYLNILLLSLLSSICLSLVNLSISLFDVNINDYTKSAENTMLSEQIPQTPLTFLSLGVGILIVLLFYAMIFRNTSFEWWNYTVVLLTCLMAFLLSIKSMNQFEKKLLNFKL